MSNLTFVAPYTNQALDSLKIAALYFDKIFIKNDSIWRWVPDNPNNPIIDGCLVGGSFGIEALLGEDFRSQIKPLIAEGIVEIIKPDYNFKTDYHFYEEDELGKRLEELFDANIDLLLRPSVAFDKTVGHKVKSLRFTEDITEIVHQFFGRLPDGALFNYGFIIQYYMRLLTTAIQDISDGNNIITSSDPLLKFIQLCHSEKLINQDRLRCIVPNIAEPRIASEIIKMSLLDVSRFDLTDILEARYLLRDELAEFREQVKGIQFQLLHEFDMEQLLIEGDKIVNFKVKPQLSEIEKKIRESRYGILKKLLSLLQKPNAYIPLLGSVFAGLPIQVAIMISLGLISAESILDYLREKRTIEGNGLFYLIKLRRRLRRLKK